MKTLIELYDERAIENVIGPETFKPDTVIYLYPAEGGPDKLMQRKLKEYFRHRGLEINVVFEECSIYKADKILRQLRGIAERYPEVVVDVTGGTDAALFAAGMFAKEQNIPAFTYSRKKNCFYDISGADFADETPCGLEYKVEDFFLMAGGSMRKGRVDNNILSRYMNKYDEFFEVFLKHRKKWAEQVTFMQRISKADYYGNYKLTVSGAYEQKGESGGRVKADLGLLNDLEKLGFIRDLKIVPEETVSFTFMNDQTRAWLRDVGSVLELYIYKACVDTKIFHDVVSSAVVDWDGTVGKDSVSNELDAVATRGVVPLFISCKATEVKTEALNELAILTDRFGGKGAKAAIVTTENCNAAARHRAAQLGIAVIDLEELVAGKAADRLKVIMKVKDKIDN